jgi:hypothetical protein
VAEATTVARITSATATAMAPKVSGAVPRLPAEVVVKITMSLVGVFAVAWGGWALPVFKAQASPQFVAAKILQGDSYKMRGLLLAEQQAETVAARYPFCNPTALHSLTAIRLGIFNNNIGASDRTLFESSYDVLRAATQQTLNCSPADSFVWLTLFWIDADRHGLTAMNEKYLRMSYASAPNEGWIALWRSHLSFALFDRLPTDLAEESIDDFLKLVQTRQVHWEMANMFENTSDKWQRRIAERLQTIDVVSRDQFVNVLRSKGLTIAIPDVVTSEPRPSR